MKLKQRLNFSLRAYRLIGLFISSDSLEYKYDDFLNRLINFKGMQLAMIIVFI